MRHSASKALFDHWSSLRQGLFAPDRNDLDPITLGPILQDVFILGSDIQGEWHYRVAGTRLTAYAGRELRDESFLRWWRAADRLDAKRLVNSSPDHAPLVGAITGMGADQQQHDFELLLLPLRHGGRPHLRMIGGLFPFPRTVTRMGICIEELGLTSLRSLIPGNADSPVFGREPGNLESILERRRAFRLIKGGARQGHHGERQRV